MSLGDVIVVRGSGRNSRARMRGLSLVELMIATTISLVILAAVGWVYQGTSQTYRSHDALARMQEGARYAFELMSKDLRMAGVTGCPYETSKNVLGSPTDWYKNLFKGPISAADKNGATGAFTEFSDSLSVVRADVSREYIVNTHDNAGGAFTLINTPDFPGGQLMVATDCNNASVFQATGVSADAKTVSYSVGGLNATADLGTTYAKVNGARLYRMSAVMYHVAPNSAGVPALFRATPTGAAGALVEEELVEGVEDLQFSFTVDSTAAQDGEADYYTKENADTPYVTPSYLNNTASDSATLGGTAELRWGRVTSVRMSLLMRTVEDRMVPTKQKYTYNGVNTTATDLRIRKVFTHVIKLRNR
jgi:type IV pilus assembly protein PilW